MDRIADHRVGGPKSRRRYEFLVHWVGYADPTWEPRAILPEELVSRYFQALALSHSAQRRNDRRRKRQRRVHFTT